MRIFKRRLGQYTRPPSREPYKPSLVAPVVAGIRALGIWKYSAHTPVTKRILVEGAWEDRQILNLNVLGAHAQR